MPLRCLLVDDDKTVLRAGQRYLAHRGFSVDVATCGATAREHAGPYDCIVLDIDLGSESGIDLAREFHNRRTDCIVFFSASTDVDVRVAASEFGTFIGKEAGLFALSQAIEAAVTELRQAALAVGDDAPRSSRADPRLGSGFRKRR
jgi:DNA-binding response OmpR family regulator